MNKDTILELLKLPAYNFLKTSPNLDGKVVLLSLGGSHAYGTSTPTSDVDLRGCAVNSPSDLIGLSGFDQVIDKATDTTIYSVNKLFRLLLNCNPNCIEMLRCREDHYAIKTEIGQMLIDNTDLFLSQRAVNSFGGYAYQQLNRLQSAVAIDRASDIERERHLQRSLNSAMMSFSDRYTDFDEGSITISVDESSKSDFDEELFVNIDLKHYPLRDIRSIMNEMTEIVRNYDKLNHRNNKKVDNHLNKHAMHLVRLYLMSCDILEKHAVVTYRSDEHDMLMDIRNGKYMSDDGRIISAFFDMLGELEKRFNYAKLHTSLPKHPDMNRANELLMDINKVSLGIRYM